MERGASPLGDNDSDAALLVLPMDSGMSIATGYADSEKTAVVQPQPAIIAVQPAPVIQPAYAAASVTPLRHLKREPAHVDCPHCHERRLTRVTKYKEDAVGDCCMCLCCGPQYITQSEDVPTKHYCTVCTHLLVTIPSNGTAIQIHEPDLGPQVLPSMYASAAPSRPGHRV